MINNDETQKFIIFNLKIIVFILYLGCVWYAGHGGTGQDRTAMSYVWHILMLDQLEHTGTNTGHACPPYTPWNSMEQALVRQIYPHPPSPLVSFKTLIPPPPLVAVIGIGDHHHSSPSLES